MGADSGEDLIAGFTCKGSFDPYVLSVLCRLGFLVKPFQKEDLHTAIEIAMMNHQRNLPKQKEKFIIFHSGKQTIKFKQLDIRYIQSSENYAQLYLSDGQRKLLRATLKDIYSLLPTQHFVYINRSTIVNVHHITQITTDSVWLGPQSFNLSATMRKEVVKAWEGTNGE